MRAPAKVALATALGLTVLIGRAVIIVYLDVLEAATRAEEEVQ